MEKGSRKSVLPLAEPSRNFSARGISALISPIIRPTLRRRAPAAYQIIADWDALAGPDVAGTARPVKLAGGTLTLACSGPVAMELQYRADQLIQRLNLGLGGHTVERIKFIQETAPVARPSAPKPVKAAALPPDDLPAGPLGDALAKLYKSISGRCE